MLLNHNDELVGMDFYDDTGKKLVRSGLKTAAVLRPF
jgi:hypothetical protein